VCGTTPSHARERDERQHADQRQYGDDHDDQNYAILVAFFRRRRHVHATCRQRYRQLRFPGNQLHKGKGSPYSITERKVPELIPVLGSQSAGDVSLKPGVGCHYFPPGLQLPPQRLRGLLPISLLGEHWHDGCEQFA